MSEFAKSSPNMTPSDNQWSFNDRVAAFNQGREENVDHYAQRVDNYMDGASMYNERMTAAGDTVGERVAVQREYYGLSQQPDAGKDKQQNDTTYRTRYEQSIKDIHASYNTAVTEIFSRHTTQQKSERTIMATLGSYEMARRGAEFRLEHDLKSMAREITESLSDDGAARLDQILQIIDCEGMVVTDAFPKNGGHIHNSDRGSLSTVQPALDDIPNGALRDKLNAALDEKRYHEAKNALQQGDVEAFYAHVFTMQSDRAREATRVLLIGGKRVAQMRSAKKNSDDIGRDYASNAWGSLGRGYGDNNTNLGLSSLAFDLQTLRHIDQEQAARQRDQARGHNTSSHHSSTGEHSASTSQNSQWASVVDGVVANNPAVKWLANVSDEEFEDLKRDITMLRGENPDVTDRDIYVRLFGKSQQGAVHDPEFAALYEQKAKLVKALMGNDLRRGSLPSFT